MLALKTILSLGLFALGFLVSLGVMIYGWGLEPHSWGWIIGGGIAGALLTMIGAAIASLGD